MLMRVLRNSKNINIKSSQKRSLMNIGYYHGYKGYRYINNPSNRIAFTEFDELLAIYNFDSHLKTLFYPSVMFIETALKNYVLETITSATGTDSFPDVYNKLLDNYKNFSTAGKSYKNDHSRKSAEDKYKRELKKRLDLRNRIYKIQSDAFGNDNKIAKHYLEQDRSMPIWAIFELLSLGEFGHFVSCLNLTCRKNISSNLGIRQSDDNAALLPQRLIYAVKDLRNAIAHNDVIFDTRFKSGSIDKHVGNSITNATGIKNITFDTITDYLIMIVYILKLLGTTKTELKKIVRDYEDIVEHLRTAIPTSIFNQIVHTNSTSKVHTLKQFISM